MADNHAGDRYYLVHSLCRFLLVNSFSHSDLSGSLMKGFATLAIHAGQPADPITGAVMPPISLSTTFAQSSPGVNKVNCFEILFVPHLTPEIQTHSPTLV